MSTRRTNKAKKPRRTRAKQWGVFDQKKGRKRALRAWGTIRRLAAEMRRDASIHESTVSSLVYLATSMAETIDVVLPESRTAQGDLLAGMFEASEQVESGVIQRSADSGPGDDTAI
jgi:hypothetical protein